MASLGFVRHSKLHAFFEAVITNFLVVSLERENLRDTLSHFPLSDKKFGKMEFVRALSLLSERPLKFISALSELRNRLVHDVKNVNFDLKVYVGGLDSNQLKNFKRSFGFFFESIENGEAELSRLLVESPKIIVLISAYECLMQIHFKKQDARIQRMDAELARLVYERHRE
jgi:hypothetical protein